MNSDRYPDIEGDAIRYVEELTQKAAMYDKFVAHVVANSLVLSDTEYEMLGLRERAEELRTKGIKQMLERCGHGR